MITATPVTNGRPLGYYHYLARYLIIIPLIALLLVAIVYNVFVGIATWWMYKNANFKPKKEEKTLTKAKTAVEKEDDDDAYLDDHDTAENLPDHLHTSIWEDIFVTNIRICNFLLGTSVKLKNLNHYLVLLIHDFVMFMPLAMIFLQLCQFAVCVVITAIFMDNLILEVI